MIKLMRQEIRRIFKSKSLYITIGIGVFFTLWLLVDQLTDREIWHNKNGIILSRFTL